MQPWLNVIIREKCHRRACFEKTALHKMYHCSLSFPPSTQIKREQCLLTLVVCPWCSSELRSFSFHISICRTAHRPVGAPDYSLGRAGEATRIDHWTARAMFITLLIVSSESDAFSGGCMCLLWSSLPDEETQDAVCLWSEHLAKQQSWHCSIGTEGELN